MPQRHSSVCVISLFFFHQQLWDLQKSVYFECCEPVLLNRHFKGFSRPVCTSTRPCLDNYWAKGSLQAMWSRNLPREIECTTLPEWTERHLMEDVQPVHFGLKETEKDACIISFHFPVAFVHSSHRKFHASHHLLFNNYNNVHMNICAYGMNKTSSKIEPVKFLRSTSTRVWTMLGSLRYLKEVQGLLLSVPQTLGQQPSWCHLKERNATKWQEIPTWFGPINIRNSF